MGKSCTASDSAGEYSGEMRWLELPQRGCPGDWVVWCLAQLFCRRIPPWPTMPTSFCTINTLPKRVRPKSRSSATLRMSGAAMNQTITAQLFELEHGFTDLWTSALYLEGAKTEGGDRLRQLPPRENCVRLSKRDVTFFNPVFYAEIPNKKSRHLSSSQLSLVGPTNQKARRRLSTNWRRESIFGHDLTDPATSRLQWKRRLEVRAAATAIGNCELVAIAQLESGKCPHAASATELRHAARPLWVISGHTDKSPPCPFFPRKRTGLHVRANSGLSPGSLNALPIGGGVSSVSFA